MTDANFEKTCQVKFWTQKVIPLVYDNSLSVIELIGKVIDQLNILIQNNNEIPDLIAQTIQEYITSGAIGEVVEDILANYILNVKYPPEGIPSAKGDGTADDTEAIQRTINYASVQGGGAVYFPAGKYLTGSLTIPSNVSLFGFDRYQTSLVLKSGAVNPLISSTGTDFGIYKLTLNANMGVQVNNINVVSLISQDVLLSELIIDNGYHGIVYNGTGGHLQINNIVFGNCVYECANISGNSYVQMENVLFTNISSVSGVDIINISSDGGSYKFKSVATCPLCLSISGNDNFVDCLISGAVQNFNDSGLRNTIIVRGSEKKEQYSGDVDLTVQGNVGINANGTWSETVSGAFSSVHSNGENTQVKGIATKTYETFVENVSSKKSINAQDIWLNPTNPLQYKTPANNDDNRLYKTIPFKDSNQSYNLLVEKEYLSNYAVNNKPVNVLLLGFDNSGTQDCSVLFNTYIEQFPLYFPAGNYKFDNPIYLKNSIYGFNISQSLSNNSNMDVTRFISNISTGYLINITDSNIAILVKSICCVLNNNIGAISFQPESASRLYIDNVSIYNLYNAIGINISPINTISRACYINNTLIDGGNTTATTAIYFNDNAPDCNITNSIIRAVQIGVNCNSLNIFINNTHIWTGNYGNLTTEWWSNTICLKLNKTIVTASNLYLDSGYNLITAENNCYITIDNLLVWYDASGSGLDLNSATLFNNAEHDSYLYINGGFIYGNVYFQNTCDINIFTKNVTIASSNTNVRTPIAYPSEDTSAYRIRNNSTNTYEEIARFVWNVNNKIISFYISLNYSLVRIIAINNNGTTNVYKQAINENLTLYYKVENNYLIILGASDGVYYISAENVGYENRMIIYNLNVLNDRVTPYQRNSQNDTTGLTEINAQS